MAHSAGKVQLRVRLTPKSRRDEVFGVATIDGERLVLARVRAVPEKGKANAALERLIAAWLDIATSHVAVTSGATARYKTLAIAGEAEVLAARIANLTAALAAHDNQTKREPGDAGSEDH